MNRAISDFTTFDAFWDHLRTQDPSIDDKTYYVGRMMSSGAAKVVIRTGNQERDLMRSNAANAIRPQGFAWGYTGTLPLELAMTLIYDVDGAWPLDRRNDLYKLAAKLVVDNLAKILSTEFVMPRDDLKAWLRDQRAEGR